MQKSAGKPRVIILCKAICDWLMKKMNKNELKFINLI